MKAEWTNRDSLASGETTKAILVIDIPDGEKIEDYLADIWRRVDGNVWDEVLDNIELKPMPQRIEQGYPTDDYTIGKADGWNACLEEIEK